jgi:hypothetical protein
MPINLFSRGRAASGKTGKTERQPGRHDQRPNQTIQAYERDFSPDPLALVR